MAYYFWASQYVHRHAARRDWYSAKTAEIFLVFVEAMINSHAEHHLRLFVNRMLTMTVLLST